MSKPIRFGIVAGEKSGDMLGAGLISALRVHYPHAEFTGIGGTAMIAAGCISLAPIDRLSVMGYVEPLGRLPELLRIKKRLHRHFVAKPPAAVICIDAPGFNLSLELGLRRHSIKTVHYVSPSVWAYREKRIHKIKKAVDLMLTLFPFETQIYQDYEIEVKCVGHPLADSIGFEDNKIQDRQGFGLAANDTVIALMSGSRGGEIKRLGPVFIAAAIAALQDCPQLKFLLPCSSPENRMQIKNLLASANIFPGEQFRVVDDSQLAISACDLVLLASGTATLEAMLLRRPMVVCYKLAAITYAIASRMMKIPYFALPNLLAGKQLVPEYIQHRASANALQQEIVNFVKHPTDVDGMLSEFDVIHRSIRLDASRQAAQAIVSFLQVNSAPKSGST